MNLLHTTFHTISPTLSRTTIRTVLPTLLACVLLAACQRDASAPEGPTISAPATPPTTTAPANADEQRIANDVRALADDRFEGREAGTRGYDLAAEYVAQRYADIGLQPAGDDGTWFQTVPLLKATREADGAA